MQSMALTRPQKLCLALGLQESDPPRFEAVGDGAFTYGREAPDQRQTCDRIRGMDTQVSHPFSLLLLLQLFILASPLPVFSYLV